MTAENRPSLLALTLVATVSIIAFNLIFTYVGTPDIEWMLPLAAGVPFARPLGS